MTRAGPSLGAPRCVGAQAGEERRRGRDRRPPRRCHGVARAPRGASGSADPTIGRRRHGRPRHEGPLRAAQSRSAALSHLSAAVHHGWKVKTVPDAAWVTVPRNRRLRDEQRVGVRAHHAALGPQDVHHGVTVPLRTVLDCARTLAFDEALAVADSALRARDVTKAELREVAARAAGPGARQLRRVAAHADGRAANPFESVLRALCIDEGFDLAPQLELCARAVRRRRPRERGAPARGGGRRVRHHGTRRGLRKDCRRHTELSVFGYSSLRYAFEDVMGDQPWVRWTLRSWRDVREGRVPGDPPTRLHGRTTAT